MENEHSRREFLKNMAAGITATSLAGGAKGGADDLNRIHVARRTKPAASMRSETAHFVEVASEAGVIAPNVWGGVNEKRFILETKGNGVAFLDYDGDGWLDIYLSNGTRLEGFPRGEEPTNHLYHNNRDGTFTDVTGRSGLARTGWQTGVCVGDYDNDGREDLFLTYWGQNRLFHNNGNGTFTDVTERAGLIQTRVRWGTGCAFLDYDRDGWLDIFVANYIEFDPKQLLVKGNTKTCEWKGMGVLCGPNGLQSGRNVLYHNNGDGTFTDVSEISGIAKSEGKGIGVVCCDFDNDGWSDIYVANDSTPSELYHNNHDGTFSQIGMEQGVALSPDGLVQGGMGVTAGDYDNDGWLDIFKTNFSDQTPNLYHNNHDGSFTDLVFASGLGTLTALVSWGTGFVDVDNDGWLDLFYVNGHVYPEVDQYHMDSHYRQPRLLYHNLGNGRFQDVSTECGPAFEERYSSRGCAFGDFDNDGRIDILIMNMNDKPSLWRNETLRLNNSVVIKLTGVRSNRSAIGTRVRIEANGHAQWAEVHSGGSVMSMSDLRLHFGLGKAERISQLEIRWPSGIIEKLKDVNANRILYIREGAGIVKSERFASSREY
ncbi:MAG TPA: CRTAC1 family protein [Terriglobia bacterium]|nr:CRTAC1 family protein [Terriglobia bacterium]